MLNFIVKTLHNITLFFVEKIRNEIAMDLSADLCDVDNFAYIVSDYHTTTAISLFAVFKKELELEDELNIRYFIIKCYDKKYSSVSLNVVMLTENQYKTLNE